MTDKWRFRYQLIWWLRTLVLTMLISLVMSVSSQADVPQTNLPQLSYFDDDVNIRVTDVTGQLITVIETSRDERDAGRRSLSFVWSPDGNRVAFTSGGDIWIHDVGTNERTQVSFDQMREVFGGLPQFLDVPTTWSPDGRWLTFQKYSFCFSGTQPCDMDQYIYDTQSGLSNSLTQLFNNYWLSPHIRPRWVDDTHFIAGGKLV